MAIRWLLLSIAFSAGCSVDEPYDLVIMNGTIYDGSGTPYERMDLGIRDGRIATIGKLEKAAAVRVIDANGLVVSPGFIDLHTHLELIDRFPDCENLVRQGITTALGGPDGGGPWPFEAQLEALTKNGAGINVGFLVGHNVIRKNVMQLEDRTPTPTELAEMKRHVSTAMEAGAFGISTGLKYLPGCFSKTDEIIELSKVASAYGGFYTSHLRDEGLGLLSSVREAVSIGREANIPIVLTHHKVVGKPMWGGSRQSLAIVDSARAAGQDVMLDQYPYAASRTGIGILIPSWALEGGVDSFNVRIANKRIRDRVKQEVIVNLINDRGGNDLRRVQLSHVSWNPELDGITLYDWCVLEEMRPTIENGAELVITAHSRGDTRCIFHAMDEGDIIRIMQHPFTAIATDAVLTDRGSGPVHPRAYGTFPRVLSKYVRHERVIRLEEAIRKMTSLPARRLGLTDRGLLKQNYWADVVIFDEDSISDVNSFEDPHQYPAGIKYVLVNGKVTVESGTFHQRRAGKVLFGPGRKEQRQ